MTTRPSPAAGDLDSRGESQSRGGLVLPDAPAFRDAMAQIASAVHLVTTLRGDERLGLTATSFTSVSDAPPTVLVCIDAGSRTLAAIEASGVFCVNTLAGGGTALAETFAGRLGIDGAARFATADWTTLETGSPVLVDALAAFDCRVQDIHAVATHRIIIGQVVALGGPAQGTGLSYRRRAFEAL